MQDDKRSILNYIQPEARKSLAAPFWIAYSVSVFVGMFLAAETLRIVFDGHTDVGMLVVCIFSTIVTAWGLAWGHRLYPVLGHPLVGIILGLCSWSPGLLVLYTLAILASS